MLNLTSQVSLNFVQRFQRRSRKCLGQSEAGVAIFASCQISANSVQRVQRSRKCLSISEARSAILFSHRPPEQYKPCRGCRHLASSQVSLNFVQLFQRRNRTCEKLTTDDRQRMITIMHLNLPPVRTPGVQVENTSSVSTACRNRRRYIAIVAETA